MKIKFTAEAMKKPENMSTLAELAWNYFDFPCGTWCVAQANETVIVTDESADFDSAVVFPDNDSFHDWLEYTAREKMCCVEDARSFLIAAGAIGSAVATDDVVKAVMDSLLSNNKEPPTAPANHAGGEQRNGVDWDYYDRFKDISEKYLPLCGEGETVATQICTAVNKLVYKWYNDGDVYDNQHVMDGFGNDLSSYANWLYKYIDDVPAILDRIETCKSEAEYERILKDLADYLMDEEKLAMFNKLNKVGSIYDCQGPFAVVDYCDDDEDWD